MDFSNYAHVSYIKKWSVRLVFNFRKIAIPLLYCGLGLYMIKKCGSINI